MTPEEKLEAFELEAQSLEIMKQLRQVASNWDEELEKKATLFISNKVDGIGESGSPKDLHSLKLFNSALKDYVSEASSVYS